MRATSLLALAGLAVLGTVTTPSTQAAGVDKSIAALGDAQDRARKNSDDLGSPLSAKKAALRDRAIEKRIQGQDTAARRGGHGAKGQTVELERQADDPVFVLLVEFGDEQYPNAIFQGPPPDESTTDVTGPMHNEIPQPDRRTDNSTLWQADYNVAHYENMYFTRMADYYKRQSSNRYSVHGDVNGWVKVPFNEALYGRNYCGDIVCNTTKALVRDGMAAWVAQELAAGKTTAQIAAYLQDFDVWDRYDLDGDGDFAEPDGFIDHMQVVHAGGDEAAGDPNQGTDAIWSHRWYANLQAGGPSDLTGFDVGSNGGLVSSPLVPNNPVGVWVGDYTIQPENGGLGVFAHEYGHDLGLPDLYDTSGNTGGAENSTAFWSLMSSGANIGDGGRDGIGDNPTDLSAWELLRLGWLNAQGDKGPFYEVVEPGARSRHVLGPNTPATRANQAIVVSLPDKEVTTQLGPVAAGTKMFWSTQGDDLNTTMTKTGVTGTELAAKVRFDIEEDWDYAFLEASTDGGGNWLPVETNLSDTTGGDQSGFNTSLTGLTGTTAGFPTAWVDLTATLPGGTNAVRFRYQTDGAVAQQGLMVDSITLNGADIGTAESEEGWVLDGFVITGSTTTTSYFNAYVLENRQYDGYDKSLKTAYNFGFANARPDWVETYRYQPGLLIWYWDTSYGDNNVGDHPGSGLILPVDAHPTFQHWADGELMRPRILSADSTFGTQKVKAFTVHKNSQPSTIRQQPAQRTFDDTRAWWFNSDRHAATGSHIGRYQPGWVGVKVPKTGTVITVLDEIKGGSSLLLSISGRKS
ncbi:MAG: immune inhibitor A [Actinomycetales bacterium]|nr:immune inhibitor A [Actinomycetales bacterium]